jgi:uncharacterized protein (TIGR02611 family)
VAETFDRTGPLRPGCSCQRREIGRELGPCADGAKGGTILANTLADMRTLRRILSRRMVRKVGIAVAGFSVLLAGVVMIVLPGPAVVVIPLGLTILSKEYPWAKRVMSRLQTLLNSQATAARRWLLLTSRRARAEAAATVRATVRRMARVSRINPRITLGHSRAGYQDGI